MFNVENTLISIGGYPLSYVECIASISGLVCVWLGAKESIWTWLIGIINIFTLLILFYQVQLYADVFLQVYFFATAIYGWIFWRRQQQAKKPISLLSKKNKLLLLLSISFVTIIGAYYMQKIHLVFPMLFQQPAAYPFLDTFIAVASVVGNILLARRILENWILWIWVDIVCVYVYINKHIYFVAAEYALLGMIAIYGYYEWKKKQEIKCN